jgi:4-hydroxyphenylpyruvate dioxygenase
VHRGRLDHWAQFYERIFNFRQIRYFDITGRLTGLHSRAMTSPDGKIRIPINEDAGEHGQIAEYLQQYRGEGIQHIALGAQDLYASIESLIAAGVDFMPAPNDVYYARVDQRLPRHQEISRGCGALASSSTAGVVEGNTPKVALQRFGKTAIGPIFFRLSSARVTTDSAKATSRPWPSRSRTINPAGRVERVVAMAWEAGSELRRALGRAT